MRSFFAFIQSIYAARLPYPKVNSTNGSHNVDLRLQIFVDDIDNKDKVWKQYAHGPDIHTDLILYDTFGHKADPKEMGK